MIIEQEKSSLAGFKGGLLLGKIAVLTILAVLMVNSVTTVEGATQNGTVRWTGASSAVAGETFYVGASVYVTITGGWMPMTISRPSNLATFEQTSGQYRCVASGAGSVTFNAKCTYDGKTYTDSRTVTIVSGTPPTPPAAPKLGSVSVSVSSTSVAPGESVTCSLSAYSTTGTSIAGGTKSWSISSVTNDTISDSGVVSVDPAPVPRIISITGKCTYDGVAKSDTKTVEVVPLIVPTPVITPEDGMIIGESQSVLLSCEDEDAQIYYTTDGSEPTVESALYGTRFRVSGKATVKAVAVHDGRLDSEVAVAHYALGQCPDPVIVSVGGETFLQKGNQVSIDWECADGVLRYTTDGGDVTETSPEYVGAFTVDETTTIKAKAFGKTYFDSKQIELTIRYLMHTITFDSCGGPEIPSALLQEELVYGELPVPTRDGCVFRGWYTEPKGGERVTSDTLVDVDRTLYAHWRGISDVKVFSGRPWQEVVIGYTIIGSTSEPIGLRTIVSDHDAGVAWTNVTYEAAALTEGCHQFKWNAAKVCSTNFEVKTQLLRVPVYCVIDLSGGTNAKSYPVTYMDVVPGDAWSDDYKATKLVLRVLNAGAFIMGTDSLDDGHRVILTRPFYIGVFEVTQKQWTLVTGDKRGDNDYGIGDNYPVYHVSYNEIVGDFMEKLTLKTGLNLGLPTEAQWEYACRAGSTTAYYWGDTMNGDYAWYNSNSNGRAHSVGTKEPNAWGLYDMVGNVREWCSDWFGTLVYGVNPTTSATSKTKRVLRGGGWLCSGADCLSSARWGYQPSNNYNQGGGLGFRILCDIH